jgi:molybdate transport system substrate-binding protein
MAKVLVVVVLAAAMVGCGAAAPRQDARATLTVLAAASLRGTFTELGRRFEAAHPTTTVTFAFAGSADLAAQLQHGAAADVFASADEPTMDRIAGAGLADGDPVRFASNTLQIAVAPDNPAQVASLRDLTRPGVTVAVCAPQVPCGSATEAVERAAGLSLEPVTEESSVTDVLAKVTTGQVDAGLVYVTDIRAAGAKVRGIPFAESAAAVNRYPIAVLSASRNRELARQFVRLVTGSEGRQVLEAAGFAGP